MDIWDELEAILVVVDEIVVKKELAGYSTQIKYPDQDSLAVDGELRQRPVTRVISTRPDFNAYENVLSSLTLAINAYKFDEYTATM